MRVVVDTNVVVSAFLWEGVPSRLLGYVDVERIEFAVSDALLEELKNVIHRQKFAPRFSEISKTADYVMSQYATMCEHVEPSIVPPFVLSDPDDDAVIACAKAANAKYIVTEDHHLSQPDSYEGITIVTVNQLLSLLLTDNE